MRWPLGRRARIVFGSYWLLLANKEAPQKSKHTENAMNIRISLLQIRSPKKKVENTMIQRFRVSGDRSMIYQIYPSKRTGPSHFPTQDACQVASPASSFLHQHGSHNRHDPRHALPCGSPPTAPPLDQRLGDPWLAGSWHGLHDDANVETSWWLQGRKHIWEFLPKFYQVGMQKEIVVVRFRI